MVPAPRVGYGKLLAVVPPCHSPGMVCVQFTVETWELAAAFGGVVVAVTPSSTQAQELLFSPLHLPDQFHRPQLW